MNMKHLPLLAVILVVIIGIIIVANQLSNLKPSEQSLAYLPQFSEADCGMISIRDFKDSVFLIHKGKEWVVADKRPSENTSPLAADTTARVKLSSEYPADSAFIQIALDKLKAMKKDDLISQNQHKQAELEVDSIMGTRVDVYNEKLAPILTFYVGKNSADWSSNFVRVNGSNDVYLVGGSIKYSFFTDKTRWKNKSIVKFDRSFAKVIEITHRDSATTIVSLTPPSPKDSLGKPTWQILSPVKDSAKNTEVDKILNSMSNFSAADFENDTTISKDSLGFTKPYLTVTVALENGEKKTVIVGNEKGSEGKRWVRTPDKPVTFLIYKYNVDNLDKSVNALRGIEEKKPAQPVKPAPAQQKKTEKKEKKKSAAKAVK
ncbi:MAG TPA: DUF4340 domain-containing protein [Chitinivibrionales bacterium]|nr:DUF4340 domain-containing protein [Chitinivibrionales bacterium]